MEGVHNLKVFVSSFCLDTQQCLESVIFKDFISDMFTILGIVLIPNRYLSYL